jgi:hypothetical protein
MFIAAHQHDYERDKPFYNNITANFTADEGEHTITNSSAPINIVEGSAGNNYYMPPNIYTAQPFTQYQSVLIGLGTLTILNKTHLYWE